MLPTHPRRSRRSPRRHRPPVPRAAPYPSWQRRGRPAARAAAGTRGQMQPLFCVAASHRATHRDGGGAREAACQNTAGRPGTCVAHSPAAAAPRGGRAGGRRRGGPASPRRSSARARPARPRPPPAPLGAPGPARQPVCPEARASLCAHTVLLGPAPGEVRGANAGAREPPRRGPVG